jgi:hypothetical protein
MAVPSFADMRHAVFTKEAFNPDDLVEVRWMFPLFSAATRSSHTYQVAISVSLRCNSHHETQEIAYSYSGL